MSNTTPYRPPSAFACARLTLRAREPVLDVQMEHLIAAVRRVLASLPEAAHHQVLVDRFSVQEAMTGVLDLLREAAGPLLFERLLLQGRTRRRVVVTFLALLELAKIQAVRLYQDRGERGDPFGPIQARLAIADAEQQRILNQNRRLSGKYAK